mgnify:CR=1 FL=1
MTSSLIAALVWFLAANLRAMFPSKDQHWRFAYVMIVIGVPILIWVFVENGPTVGGGVLLMGLWVLRWPRVPDMPPHRRW